MKLSTRITFSAIVLVLASWLLWIVNNNKLESVANVQDQTAVAELSLRIQGTEIGRSIKSLRQDVLFLSKLPPVSGIIRATENNGFDPRDKNDYATWVARFQDILVAFIEAHPEYSRARLIGVAEGGKVLARVVRHDGRVEITPKQLLGAKGNSNYFKAGLSLQEGQVYLSDINLEKDDNKLEVPHQLTLRAVTPIFNASGQLFGMVVLNMDMQPLLKASLKTIPVAFDGYIANQHGYYLSHPDSNRDYEFEFGRKANIGDDFPVLKSMLETRALSNLQLQPVDGGVSGYVAAQRILLDDQDPTKFLLLACHISQQKIEANSHITSLPNVLNVTLIAIIFAALFLWILRRTFIPLNRITTAAREIAAGNHSLRLTESGKDEIGQLSAALNNMLDELSGHEQIKKENVFRRAITETAHDGYWLVNMQGYLLEVNQAYVAMSGYAMDDLVGMHVSQLEAKELSEDEVNTHLKKIIELGLDFFETQHRHKDGRILDVEVSTSFIPASQQLVAFIHNITERKQSEVALKDSEFRWKFAIEGAGDGVWDWNIQTDEVQYSYRWKEMLGYSDKALSFQKCPDSVVILRYSQPHLVIPAIS